MLRSMLLFALFVTVTSKSCFAQNTKNFPALGQVQRLDPALNDLIPEDARIEVLAGGFEWAEGPVWVTDKESGFLLFSDIPHNKIVKWEEGIGASTFLQPAGYTGVADYGAEPGTNGLLLDAQGQLVACEH